MAKLRNKAVFFDRDGVLNIDTGYTHRLDDCVMINGADLALKMANDHGYQAFIVTNQGGIGLGYYTHADMDAFNTALCEKLSGHGGVITAIAASPHHPKAIDPALRESPMRKPNPGMLLKLADDHDIDLKASFMIGDRDTDIAAAHAAGCDGYLFDGDDLYQFMQMILAERQ